MERQELFKKYLSQHLFALNANKNTFQYAYDFYDLNFSKYLPQHKDAIILDIGCGMGHFLYFLQKKRYNNFLGIDISKEAIDYCQKNVTKNVHLIDNLESFLSKNKERFDTIVMNDVLEHLPKETIIPLLKKTHEVLRDDGSVIIKTINAASIVGNYTRYYDFTHELSFTEHGLRQILLMSHFKNIKILPIQYYRVVKLKRLLRLINNKLLHIFWRIICFSTCSPHNHRSHTGYWKKRIAVQKKIKILFIIDIIDPVYFLGGAEIHTFDIIKHLDESKFQIYCICDNAQFLNYIKQHIHKKITIKKINKKTRTYGDPIFFFQIFKIIRKIKPHILHTQKLKSSIWGRIAGKIAGVPIIISTLHGAPSFWKFSKIRILINRIANTITANFFSNINIALSQLEKETLINKECILSKKIKVIYNGIFKTDLYKPKENVVNKNVHLICVGRLSWEKGHSYLIKAMVLVKEKMPNIKLFLVGNGPEENALQRKVRNNNMTKNIIFLGHVDREKIPYLLLNADIFVLSSLWEASPLYYY